MDEIIGDLHAFQCAFEGGRIQYVSLDNIGRLLDTRPEFINVSGQAAKDDASTFQTRNELTPNVAAPTREKNDRRAVASRSRHRSGSPIWKNGWPCVYHVFREAPKP